MDDNPFQAGLGFTCKLKTSMPFQGRTALEALKGQGLSKKKVCFTLQDKYVFGIKACFRGRRCAATQPLAYFLLFSSRSVCLIGMEAVVRNDQVIGFIRRADYGFFIDMPIAYGYVLILLRTYYILCSSDEILWWKMILGAWSILFLLKNKYSLFCF